MNDLQRKILEITKVFICVCEEHNLEYFAIGGTCLGAARHNGFIPWDDDADFAMPRCDYELLRNNWKQWLPEQYYYQSWETEKEYQALCAKIRDSRTTAVEPHYKDITMRQGVWIDIFPIDGMPILPDTFNRKIKFSFYKMLFARYYLSFKKGKRANSFFNHRMIISFSKLLVPFKNTIRKMFIRYNNKHTINNSKYIYLSDSSLNTGVFPAEFFKDYISVTFEDITIRVPSKYDEYLTWFYGDWRKLPPKKSRINKHGCIILDLHNPYEKYENKNG